MCQFGSIHVYTAGAQCLFLDQMFSDFLPLDYKPGILLGTSLPLPDKIPALLLNCSFLCKTKHGKSPVTKCRVNDLRQYTAYWERAGVTTTSAWAQNEHTAFVSQQKTDPTGHCQILMITQSHKWNHTIKVVQVKWTKMHQRFLKWFGINLSPHTSTSVNNMALLCAGDFPILLLSSVQSTRF